MKTFDVNNVIIEVTRKCNMTCEHCLRGPAQNLNIDHKYISTLLDNINSIGVLTFTGGEPSLNIPAMRFTLEELKRRKINVNSFFIVTNGSKKSYSPEFLQLLLDLYLYQDADIKDFCSMVELSVDNYHYGHDQAKAIKMLSAFSFFRVRDNTGDRWSLINEGRAKTNGLGERNLGDSEREWDGYVEGEVYLNARGMMCADCDYSYKTQNRKAVCSVNEFGKFIEKLIKEAEEWEFAETA